MVELSPQGPLQAADGRQAPAVEARKIQPNKWLPEYTTELLALLRVLTRLVALEPKQAELLNRIVEGPTIDSDTLSAAGSLSEASAEENETEGDEENEDAAVVE